MFSWILKVKKFFLQKNKLCLKLISVVNGNMNITFILWSWYPSLLDTDNEYVASVVLLQNVIFDNLLDK